MWDQGQAEYEKGRYDQALRYYESALAASRHTNDLDGAGSTLYSIGLAYESLDRFDRALASYEASLAIYRQLNSPPDMAINLLNMGAIEYRTFARYDTALSHLQEALKIFRQINEEEFSALAGFHLGTLYVNTGQYRVAMGYLEDSLRTNRKLKSAEGTASVLHNLGRAHAGLGEYQRAIPLYEEAVSIDRKLNRFDNLAADLTSLGYAYNDLYKYDKALDYYREALDLARSRNLPGRTATALNNIGTLYFDLGRYETALTTYQDALKINRELSRETEIAVALNNIGNLYAAIGIDDKALPYFKEALAINRARHRLAETAVNLNNIGMNYYRTGRYDRALEYLGEAMKIRKQLGNPHEVARVLDNIGAVYLFKKRYQEAKTTFLERKALQAKIPGIHLNYSGLVETCIATGRYAEARAYLMDMPSDARQRDAYRIDYHSQLGRIYKGERRYAEASAELLTSVLIIEEMRHTAGEKSGFLGGGSAGGRARAYRALVESLAERAIAGESPDSRFSAYGRDAAAAAFYFAEATRARTLLEALASSSKKQGGARLPDHLREKEAVLLSRLDELDKRWEAAYRQGGAALDEMVRDKARLTSQLSSFAAELRKDAPLYAALHYPRPMAPEALSLKPDEVLLEYALGETACYIFVVEKGAISRIIRIPEGREALEAKVKRLVESMSENSGAGFTPRSARELFDLLLSKALAPVADGTKVVIIPDGMLGMLPFEALVVAEGTPAVYATDRWNFTYTQSATILGLSRMLPAPRADRVLFALGNPIYAKDDPRYIARLSGSSATPSPAGNDPLYGYRGVTVVPRDDSDRDEWKEVYFPPLPETEDEVRAIAAILGVSVTTPDVLLGIYASETRLRTSPLGDYRMLHFATHADLPGKVQGIREPFLLLGQVENRGDDDGFLTLSEVLDLDLHADQVVLSACVTGKGEIMEGEGVGSLARAFIHAGARSVVVSLWNLASVEAVEYMTRYYNYLKVEKDHSNALRLARRDMKAKYPNPFYWAVFVLHGEG
ncbi:MAG: tetratricopeptide repeat protein [Candidatus Glassbacteria bacterium]